MLMAARLMRPDKKNPFYLNNYGTGTVRPILPDGRASDAEQTGGNSIQRRHAQFITVMALLLFHHELAQFALQGIEFGRRRVARAR